ncbi:MAG TPA: hypothetical protein VFD75_10525 [Pyrinomonadaceae bacterium]|nr:hypothetical protein [Pyrinomonadaceae bacterium]
MLLPHRWWNALHEQQYRANTSTIRSGIDINHFGVTATFRQPLMHLHLLTRLCKEKGRWN